MATKIRKAPYRPHVANAQTILESLNWRYLLKDPRDEGLAHDSKRVQTYNLLIRDMMRYDAHRHPEGKHRFAMWKRGKGCPYVRLWIGPAWDHVSADPGDRALMFQERRHLYTWGPSPTPEALLKRLLHFILRVEEPIRWWMVPFRRL